MPYGKLLPMGPVDTLSPLFRSQEGEKAGGTLLRFWLKAALCRTIQ